MSQLQAKTVVVTDNTNEKNNDTSSVDALYASIRAIDASSTTISLREAIEAMNNETLNAQNDNDPVTDPFQKKLIMFNLGADEKTITFHSSNNYSPFPPILAHNLEINGDVSNVVIRDTGAGVTYDSKTYGTFTFVGLQGLVRNMKIISKDECIYIMNAVESKTIIENNILLGFEGIHVVGDVEALKNANDPCIIRNNFIGTDKSFQKLEDRKYYIGIKTALSKVLIENNYIAYSEKGIHSSWSKIEIYSNYINTNEYGMDMSSDSVFGIEVRLLTAGSNTIIGDRLKDSNGEIVEKGNVIGFCNGTSYSSAINVAGMYNDQDNNGLVEIYANYIGVDGNGNDMPNKSGIQLVGGSLYTGKAAIGAPGKGNVICNSEGAGIDHYKIESPDYPLKIQANYIGVTKNYTVKPNTIGIKVFLSGGNQLTIGGNKEGEGNVVCSNGSESVGIDVIWWSNDNVEDNLIQGNIVGVENENINLSHGIIAQFSGDGKLYVGSTNPDINNKGKNIVINSKLDGIRLHKTIARGNSVYTNSTEPLALGIQVYGPDKIPQVTLNNDNTLQVTTLNPNSIVDIYSNPAEDSPAQARTWIGSGMAVDGQLTYPLGAITEMSYVTVTETFERQTSELSPPVFVTPRSVVVSIAGDPLNGGGEVNGDTSSLTALQLNDGGDGVSLREALLTVNNDPTVGYITFDSNVFKPESPGLISLVKNLPVITSSQFVIVGRKAVVIDGNLSVRNGLVIKTENFRVDGLKMENFISSAIEIKSPSFGTISECEFINNKYYSIFVGTNASEENNISNNHIGINQNLTESGSNQKYGVYCSYGKVKLDNNTIVSMNKSAVTTVQSEASITNNTIGLYANNATYDNTRGISIFGYGGATHSENVMIGSENEGNVLGLNTEAIYLHLKDLEGTPYDGECKIQSNAIGSDKNGADANLSNVKGINVAPGGGGKVLIGSENPLLNQAATNLIKFNHDGAIQLYEGPEFTIRGNSISENSQGNSGIEWLSGGPNVPVLNLDNDVDLRIENLTPGATVDIYATPLSVSGSQIAQDWKHSVAVGADSVVVNISSFSLPLTSSAYLTVTQTVNGNTSAISNIVTVTP